MVTARSSAPSSSAALGRRARYRCRGTLRITGEAVCASLQGMPFEPCFHIEKTDDHGFRGSLAGLGFGYCDFTRSDIALPIARSSALQ